MLTTEWGEALDREHPLPEYPRPQLRRESYLNLNGPWEYAITRENAEPEEYDGEIIVPFAPESELSGVGRTLKPGEYLWYRRELVLPEGFNVGRVLLHFGAVDQCARVWVNGEDACAHTGGYLGFSADITELLYAEGEANEILVRVTDDTDKSYHTRGKQKLKPGGIWYTPVSGIWQTVWCESVPENYIRALYITPHVDQGAVELYVDGEGPCRALIGGMAYDFYAGTPALLRLGEEIHLWTPEDPCLYELTLALGEDRVESYFAMRSFSVQADSEGVKRLCLNGKPYFHNGLLDQGWWPDGLYTAPSDEALRFDIETAKAMGFNMLRKHIKIEPMRWYYHCDRLGMLVWQDMPSGGGRYNLLTISAPLITGIHLKDSHYRLFARTDPDGRDSFRQELEEMIRQLQNCPCIVLWVPFNEGWGQFDAKQITRLVRKLDPTRLIDHASGWHDQGVSDVRSLHVYFKPYRFRPDKKGRAVVLSEFGGYNLPVAGHTWNEKNFGYKGYQTPEALGEAVRKLYETQIIPARKAGLAADVYTQLSDVEDEVNGFVTYDRKEEKLPERLMQAIARELKGE